MEKLILIDDNKFLCDDFYLDNIKPLAKYKPYNKNSNLFEYRWINYPKLFEQIEREFIKKYCTENSIVLELGGNIGVTSCLINKITKYKHEHTVTENHSF